MHRLAGSKRFQRLYRGFVKMGWKIVAVSEAPLGKRTLRIGSKGKDVHELQQLLTESGFYFGRVDGLYGMLTEEAVTLFQKTFNLNNDGIAGPELLTTLKAAATKLNRIIYTVQPRENLNSISRKFGVSKSAWQGISGQGNPQRKIYPGMKLLLNQKVLLCSGKRTESFPATAGLDAGWEIDANGELIKIENSGGSGTFQTLFAQPEVWKKILSSHKNWRRIAVNLKRWPPKHWGIDFRNAPLETLFRWKDLLHCLCETLSIKQIPLIIITLLGDLRNLPNRLFWLNLPKISDLTKILLIEPFSVLDSPLMFLQSGINLKRVLRKIIRYNIGPKTLLMGGVGGFDWNLDQGNQCRTVSFREARLLAAMNHRMVKYNQDTNDTIVDYLRHHERHCLIFRDQQGWNDWIKIGLKFNLLGYAIHDAKDLGRFGNELIHGSFGIIPEEKI